jgi:hypothetical protein
MSFALIFARETAPAAWSARLGLLPFGRGTGHALSGGDPNAR